MRILHVITGLNTGGAEMMLLKLLTASRSSIWEPCVISLMKVGAIGKRIAALGVPVVDLGMRRSVQSIARSAALIRLTWRFRPHLIQGWMYHGNLAASLAGICRPQRPPVLWGVRQSLYDITDERRTTAAAIRLGARLSRHPAAIVYNSETSADQHEALGYRADRRVLLPNGFDTDTFRPSPDLRAQLRQELGLDENTVLVGLVARHHPLKDHRSFLHAAGHVARCHRNVHFVLVGHDVTGDKPELSEIIAQEGLQDRVSLLGERSDIESLTAALDIACSASKAEAFANVIGEAMACGVPCVVTDVGESRRIVADTGVIVPRGDPQALASGILQLVEAGAGVRASLGMAARRRIEAEYSLPVIARRYDELYDAHTAHQDPARWSNEASLPRWRQQRENGEQPWQ
jgi:glycosyltransferase involved in cell wall biosynthesis